MHKHTRLAGAAAAVLAAGLAGYSLRPSNQSANLVAARNPAAEVRTQVIRRTIHIVKHERSGQGGRHVRTLVASGGGLRTGGGRPVSTGASHHSAAAVGSGAAAPVVTRTSSHPVSSASTGAPASSGAPVTTRTSTHSSGSGSSGSSSKPVTTRTSSGGGHGGEGGDGSQNNDN